MDFTESEDSSEGESDLLPAEANDGQEDPCRCRLFCVKMHVRRVYLLLHLLMVPRLVFTIIFCPLHIFHFLPFKAFHIYLYWYISLSKMLQILFAHFQPCALLSMQLSVILSVANCLLDLICILHGLIIILYPNNLISRWTLAILVEILDLEALWHCADLAKVYLTAGYTILLIGVVLLVLDVVFLIITMKMIVYFKQKHRNCQGPKTTWA